jgi:hypothetical protein
LGEIGGETASKIKSQLLYQLSYRGNPENIIYPVAKAYGKFYRARFWEASLLEKPQQRW